MSRIVRLEEMAKRYEAAEQRRRAEGRVPEAEKMRLAAQRTRDAIWKEKERLRRQG